MDMTITDVTLESKYVLDESDPKSAKENVKVKQQYFMKMKDGVAMEEIIIMNQI